MTARLDNQNQIEPLTPREIEIIRLVACDCTNKQISRTLGISPNTVRNHITHVQLKLTIYSRVGLVLWFVRKYGFEEAHSQSDYSNQE